MAKKKTRRAPRQKRRQKPAVSKPARVPRVSTAAYAVGILLLLCCIGTSLMLALEHLGGLSLPGCGEGSACAEATASVWGKVPYVNWPVAFLGLAYFLALTGAWIFMRRGVPRLVRHLVRCGVLASVGFIVIMIVDRHVCSYCVATHVGNLAFWILIERTVRPATGAARAFATMAAVFVVSSAVLGAADWRARLAAERRAEDELADAMEAIITATSQRSASPEAPAELAAEPAGPPTETEMSQPVQPSAVVDGPQPTTEAEAIPSAQPAGEPEVTQASQPVPDAQAAEEPERPELTSASRPAPAPTGGFTGRYRRGPERAAIRVVTISDYQCQDCRQIEAQIEELFAERDDMSLSFKHFPMSTDCNPMPKRNLHPNACWAARAAETAGILRGADGFWEMHTWLFARGGSFTQAELRARLREVGYDLAEFERILKSDETLQRVKTDIAEAQSLGLYMTPMIFINGVELRGWNARNAVRRAVERLAVTNPEPMTAANDCPPSVAEKLMGDWRASPRRAIPPAEFPHTVGPEDAAVHAVIFGDYLQPGTAKTEKLIRRMMDERGDVRYEFRHYPFHQDCNPAIKKESDYPHSCRAARTAEAAARIAGNDGYWKMHAWLLANRESFDEAALPKAAAACGIDAAALLAEMAKPEVQATIVDDAKTARRLGARAIPTLFINGKRVPRWEYQELNILPDIIAEAARE